MNQLETFPIEQFYEALMSSSGLEQKLQAILKQIKTKNMEMTYQAVVHIHQILNSKLEPPLMKFNALNCAKIFFDTCEYSVILLIEVYLLPIIFQIAAFKATKKSEDGLSLYFIQRGAQPTKDVKRLGTNYVLLAIEFIYVTSQIKLYRVLQNDQLEEQSNFKKIAKALKMRGVAEITGCKFYSNTYIQQTRRIYVDKLGIFNPQSFIEFFVDLIFNQITEGKKLELDSKRLIMFGDVYIISPLVNRIQEELNEIEGNFQSKRKILTLFFQLVRFGYIQALLLLNSSQFLSAIAAQISKVNGDKDMDEGRLIYQQFDDNQKSKKAFYLEFLKNIQTLAHAVPLNQHNQISDPKRIYEFLKYQKRFKFPQNSTSHKYKSEMQIYLRQNSERNEKVIELIDNKQSISAKSRYKISSLKDQSNIKSKQKKSHLQFEQLQDIVINAMKILEIIGFNQKRYEKDMRKLLNFKENWHKNIQLVKKTVSQNDQPFNLEMLISQGQIVYDQAVGLEKIYLRFKQNKLKFQEAQQKITALLNQLDQQNQQISQVSVSAKSKNTHLTNRRDLRSKISQKVRNDKSFSDHSKNSYVSQSKSAKSNLKTTKAKNISTNKEIQNKKNISQTQGLFLQASNHPINETFAVHKLQKSQSQSIKNYKNNQPLGSLKKQTPQFLEKNNKQNGKQPQKINLQPYTATFIPIKNQKQIIEKDKNFIKKEQQSVKHASFAKNQGENKKQIFSDSFQIKSPFRKLKSNESSIQKKDQIASQSDRNDSNVLNRKNLNLKKVEKQKNSLIKRILSNQKISFHKNQSSQSQDQDLNYKLPGINQTKKISKFTSFNNGNVSGYFNQQSVQQYGLVQKLKEIKKNDRFQKQNFNDSIQIKSIIKHNLPISPQISDKEDSRVVDKFISSKQISGIEVVEPRELQTFDDFQLLNANKEYVGTNKNNLQKNTQNLRLKLKASIIKSLDVSQKIQDQSSFQMIESHYKTHQIEEDKMSKKQNGEQIKFKQIVEVKKQIIHDRNGVLSPFNYQSSDKKKTRMQKLFEFKNKGNLNNSSKKDNLMEVLSERSTKKCIQHYLIEKQKNKLIQNLNLRIKKLQNEQRTIQTKLSKKDEQLRSMSFKNYSERHKMKFMNENSGQCSFQNSSSKDNETNLQNSLYYKISKNGENKKGNKHFSTEGDNFNKQNVVDLASYATFYQGLNQNIMKKNCLKNKTLIHVTQQIQIGCMSIKKDKFINFTLFVTPKLFSVVNMKVLIQNNQNLSIAAFPDLIYSIKAKKQETINIKINVQNVPFKAPLIRLEYEMQTVGLLKNHGHNVKLKSHLEITLPCTFNKLCSFESININEFYEMFNTGQLRSDIKRTQKFKINTKIFKEERIKQYFPYLCLLKRKEATSVSKSKNLFGFQASYNGNIFLVMLKVQDNKYGVLESKNMTGQHKSQKYIEFFMATLRFLLAA